MKINTCYIALENRDGSALRVYISIAKQRFPKNYRTGDFTASIPKGQS